MARNPIARPTSRLATRFASTLLLTGALVAPSAAFTPVALATSHAHAAKRAAHCHHRHARRCARMTRHTGRQVGSAASVELVSISPGQHGVTGPAPVRSTPQPPAGPAVSTPCANADLIPTSANIPLIDAATLCLVNQQRALHGVHPLRDNAKLDSTALHHAQDMVAANYYDHTSPTGETALGRIQASGYLPSADAYEIGENIDVGGSALATPAAIVTAWMNSPGHRDNILNPDFVDSGIGVVAQVPAVITASQVGASYTQDFGVVQSPSGAIS